MIALQNKRSGVFAGSAEAKWSCVPFLGFLRLFHDAAWDPYFVHCWKKVCNIYVNTCYLQWYNHLLGFILFWNIINTWLCIYFIYCCILERFLCFSVHLNLIGIQTSHSRLLASLHRIFNCKHIYSVSKGRWAGRIELETSLVHNFFCSQGSHPRKIMIVETIACSSESTKFLQEQMFHKQYFKFKHVASKLLLMYAYWTVTGNLHKQWICQIQSINFSDIF